MAATLRSYFARCLHDSHQPVHTAKSCLKELRSYDPRLFLAKKPFASHSVGEDHDSLILLLRPCGSPSNAAPEWQAGSKRWRNFDLLAACPLEGLVMQLLETGLSEALYPLLPPSVETIKCQVNIKSGKPICPVGENQTR